MISDDEQVAAECVAAEVVTEGMLRERNYRRSGSPFEVAFLRRDGEWFVLPVPTLSRARQIISDLSLPADSIDVVAASDEDRLHLLAQVRGELPIFLH